MGSEQVNTNGPGSGPELHLLITDQQFEEPLYKSLFRELDEFFFPKKLPPLKLESKPEPVKDIWGFYNYTGKGVLGSTGIHVLIIGLIALSYVVVKRAVTPAQPQKPIVTWLIPRTCLHSSLRRHKWAVAEAVAIATYCRPAKASCPSSPWSRSRLPWWSCGMSIRNSPLSRQS